MTDKWSGINSVNEAEVELVRRQSELLLQKRQGGFNGELKTSGSIIESFIKGQIERHLPHGYKMCSGYIATPDTLNSENNLAQHDILVVDARIPPLYKFGVGDIEIVPAEAVCAIFEIKRTINIESLRSAVAHLKKTKDIIENYDPNRAKNSGLNNIVGPNLNFCSITPIYGVIAIDVDSDITKKYFLGKR